MVNALSLEALGSLSFENPLLSKIDLSGGGLVELDLKNDDGAPKNQKAAIIAGGVAGPKNHRQFGF